MLDTSKKFGLFDNTTSSTVPQTIRSIIEKDRYGFGLGARIVGETLVVDIFPNKSPSNKFEEICDHLTAQVFKCFPKCAREVSEAEIIGTRK
jgi:hypothetical protein